MRKFLLIPLIFALSLSVECKDLMASSKKICSFKKSVASLKSSPCHSKSSSKKSSSNCDCSDKKTVSIQKPGKDLKESLRLELVFCSPLNFSFSATIATNAWDYQCFHKFSLHSQISPTKTIHLLIWFLVSLSKLYCI